MSHNGKLPPPTVCPYCGSSVSLVENSAIYGRNFGAWPWAYKCDHVGCDSHVGTHPGTNFPLGTFANAELREARKLAHEAFDPLWKLGRWTRSKAYHWLSQKLKIRVWECHIGLFDLETCKRAIQVCQNRLKVKYAAKGS